MNKKNLCLVGSLAFCMSLFGSTVIAEETVKEELGEVRHYTLIEVGTISDFDKEISFQNNALLRKADGASKLLTYLGEEVGDLNISDVSYLRGGYYIVRDADTDDINCRGVYSKEGEELISCEAAMIKKVSGLYSENSSRYLQVAYATGVTEDENEAFFYTTDSAVSFSPNEGDTLYTGYARIYDLENKNFVENLKITNADRYAVDDVAGLICYEDGDKTYIYDANGTELLSTSSSVTATSDYLIIYKDGSYHVYNDELENTYTTKNSLSSVTSTTGAMYVGEYVDGTYILKDIYGNEVISNLKDIMQVEGNVAYVKTMEDRYALIRVNDGSEIESDTEAFSYEGCGLWSLRDGDTTYLYDEGGLAATGTDAIIETDSGYSMMCINDGDYTLSVEGSSAITLTGGLVKIQSESSMLYGVIDGFTGEQILDYAYSDVEMAGDYLYAYNGSGWDVYLVDGFY